MKYKEHEKLAEVKDESQAIGAFLEWLEGEGLSICRWREFRNGRNELEGTGFFPDRGPINDILARYFEIDQDELDREKRMMLDVHRLGQGDKG
jgi:hypothetical protein